MTALQYLNTQGAGPSVHIQTSYLLPDRVQFLRVLILKKGIICALVGVSCVPFLAV